MFVFMDATIDNFRREIKCLQKLRVDVLNEHDKFFCGGSNGKILLVIFFVVCASDGCTNHSGTNISTRTKHITAGRKGVGKKEG